MSLFIPYELSKILPDLMREHEEYILEQLGDFVARGLIVLEDHGTVLVQERQDPLKLKLQKTVRLVLKDKEYIAKLEKENQTLKQALACVENVIKEGFLHK